MKILELEEIIEQLSKLIDKPNSPIVSSSPKIKHLQRICARLQKLIIHLEKSEESGLKVLEYCLDEDDLAILRGITEELHKLYEDLDNSCEHDDASAKNIIVQCLKELKQIKQRGKRPAPPELKKGLSIDQDDEKVQKPDTTEHTKDIDQKVIRIDKYRQRHRISPEEPLAPIPSERRTTEMELTSLESLLQNIRQQIAEANLQAALKQLQHYLSTAEPELQNEVILYIGRYNRLNTERRRGLIIDEQFQVEVNRLSHNILEFLEKVTVNIQKTIPPILSSDISKSNIVIITAIKEEKEAVLKYLDSPQENHEGDWTFYKASIPIQGSSDSHSIILLPLHDMGNIQAAIATSHAIKAWNPNIYHPNWYSRRG